MNSMSQTGKLFLIGLQADGRLSVFERTLKQDGIKHAHHLFQRKGAKALRRKGAKLSCRCQVYGTIYCSRNLGSTTNEVRVPTLMAMNAIHPERMAEISRWSPTGAPPVKKEWCHAS